MAIINNAHAGSQVNLLCMIYRVIYRNNGKLSVDDIQALCAPKNLPSLADHEKRFPENLRFWMKESHRLWQENEQAKLALTRVATSESPLAIAVVTNEALFAPNIETIFGKDQHDTEGLFRSLSCLLASDQFTVEAGQRMNKQSLQEFYSGQLREFVPNDSEKIIVQRYGYFLGFLEMDTGGEYFADPTRAVRGVLDDVFNGAQAITVDEFLERLAQELPLLDRGVYRQQVEQRMAGPLSGDNTSRRLSKSLSLAIERLKFARVLDYEHKSDDPNACILQIRGISTPVSTLRYLSSRARQ
jgi:hypothetical protein